MDHSVALPSSWAAALFRVALRRRRARLSDSPPTSDLHRGLAFLVHTLFLRWVLLVRPMSREELEWLATGRRRTWSEGGSLGATTASTTRATLELGPPWARLSIRLRVTTGPAVDLHLRLLWNPHNVLPDDSDARPADSPAHIAASEAVEDLATLDPCEKEIEGGSDGRDEDEACVRHEDAPGPTSPSPSEGSAFADPVAAPPTPPQGGRRSFARPPRAPRFDVSSASSSGGAAASVHSARSGWRRTSLGSRFLPIYRGGADSTWGASPNQDAGPTLGHPFPPTAAPSTKLAVSVTRAATGTDPSDMASPPTSPRSSRARVPPSSSPSSSSPLSSSSPPSSSPRSSSSPSSSSSSSSSSPLLQPAGAPPSFADTSAPKPSAGPLPALPLLPHLPPARRIKVFRTRTDGSVERVQEETVLEEAVRRERERLLRRFDALGTSRAIDAGSPERVGRPNARTNPPSLPAQANSTTTTPRARTRLDSAPIKSTGGFPTAQVEPHTSSSPSSASPCSSSPSRHHHHSSTGGPRARSRSIGSLFSRPLAWIRGGEPSESASEPHEWDDGEGSAASLRLARTAARTSTGLLTQSPRSTSLLSFSTPSTPSTPLPYSLPASAGLESRDELAGHGVSPRRRRSLPVVRRDLEAEHEGWSSPARVPHATSLTVVKSAATQVASSALAAVRAAFSVHIGGVTRLGGGLEELLFDRSTNPARSAEAETAEVCASAASREGHDLAADAPTDADRPPERLDAEEPEHLDGESGHGSLDAAEALQVSFETESAPENHAVIEGHTPLRRTPAASSASSASSATERFWTASPFVATPEQPDRDPVRASITPQGAGGAEAEQGVIEAPVASSPRDVGLLSPVLGRLSIHVTSPRSRSRSARKSLRHQSSAARVSSARRSARGSRLGLDPQHSHASSEEALEGPDDGFSGGFRARRDEGEEELRFVDEESEGEDDAPTLFVDEDNDAGVGL